MLGPVGSVFFFAGILTGIRQAFPSLSGLRPLLWSWLAAALAYAYVVVTVERVDYYLYPWLPLAALFSAALVPGTAAAAGYPSAAEQA